MAYAQIRHATQELSDRFTWPEHGFAMVRAKLPKAWAAAQKFEAELYAVIDDAAELPGAIDNWRDCWAWIAERMGWTK